MSFIRSLIFSPNWFNAIGQSQITFSGSKMRYFHFYNNSHKKYFMLLYSVRGLERTELGGSHGCPGRLWYQFLSQVYQNDSRRRHDALDGVYTCHKNRSQRRPGQPWDPPNSLRSKPQTEYRLIEHGNCFHYYKSYLVFMMIWFCK